MSTTPNLAMAYLVASQAQKEVTHNDALNDLDGLAQLSVIDRTLATPPSSPSEGAAYIVAASPTGAWSGYANYVALYFSGWKFKAPQTGWRAFDRNADKVVYYTGSAWKTLNAPCWDGTATWNPGAIASGSGLTSSVFTVSGAALGDFARVAAPYSLQGVLATAYVSAADSVLVRLHNATGASVTLASGTWRVRVEKA